VESSCTHRWRQHDFIVIHHLWSHDLINIIAWLGQFHKIMIKTRDFFVRVCSHLHSPASRKYLTKIVQSPPMFEFVPYKYYTCSKSYFKIVLGICFSVGICVIAFKRTFPKKELDSGNKCKVHLKNKTKNLKFINIFLFSFQLVYCWGNCAVWKKEERVVIKFGRLSVLCPCKFVFTITLLRGILVIIFFVWKLFSFRSYFSLRGIVTTKITWAVHRWTAPQVIKCYFYIRIYFVLIKW